MQANVDLNWPNGVGKYGKFNLSDAIAHSLKTEGCLLSNKLKEKGRFGGGDPTSHENYLRVTLGQSRGNSPGIAYVLEIWPGGYYSPIHNHGNAHAVIKVLFGGLNVNLYNKLRETTREQTLPQTAEDPAVLETMKIAAGGVIWISPNWFQAHKLINPNNGHIELFCATVQCYQYGDDDALAWPYFDYLQDSQDTVIIKEFYPDHDFGFSEMRDTVMEEYFNAVKAGLGV
ncbi:hypothetical protein WJX72_005046 [[Myrmecia] bisecta]|uniref:Cysteine dioxygenase n=1 Tax=[Myrmecia] bisecta TaxID=41462 RepID=A0AAW1PPU2_9CHLO